MSEEAFTLIWVLGSLVIWLILEMIGVMADRREDAIDGTSLECLIIVLWLPILGIVLCIAPFILLGHLINKMSEIDIF